MMSIHGRVIGAHYASTGLDPVLRMSACADVRCDLVERAR